MGKSCAYLPSRGEKLFIQLKRQFGYKEAVNIFYQGINPTFIQDYSKQLVLDEEGIPTYESLMKNPYIKKFIGENSLRLSLQEKFSPIEDTADNYNMLLEEAKNFNETNANNDDFVAYVDYDENNKLQIKVVKRTHDTEKKSREQYLIKQLNTFLADKFKDLGVTVGNLTQAETAAGRVGHIDFSKARQIGKDFVSMIRVANNMEGINAISEEFAHLIIGISRQGPLVQRMIKALANSPEALAHILGEQLEDVRDYYDNNSELVAEEALGKLLQQHLVSNLDTREVPAESLFKRAVNFIRNKFKKFNADEVQKAVDEASLAMDNLAKQFLNEEKKITQQMIRDSEREAQFNDLSERIQRNIKILKEADATEIKRSKIDSSVNPDEARKMHNTLAGFAKEDADTVLGICQYAKTALDALNDLDSQFPAISLLDTKEKFTFLKEVYNRLNSYKPFIDSLLEAYQDEEMESDNMFAESVFVGEEEVNMAQMVRDLSYFARGLESKFKRTAMPLFAEFLKPYLKVDKIVVPFGKNAGKEITLTDLLKEAESDISFFDRWLDSMATSGDVLLQLFDAVVKKQNDKTREESIEGIKTVQKLLKRAEELGITDFDYFFEKTRDGKKTGNIISPINQAQFEKDKKEFEESLIEKYGKNAKGADADAKFAERYRWRAAHAVQEDGKWVADPDVYRNEDYFNLTDAQREILESWLRIKGMYDTKLDGKTYLTNAIQIRKSGARRMVESLTSPKAAFENVVRSTTEALLDKPDDENQFGVKSGFMDFSGKEYMELPVLYVRQLENPDELSDDVMGNLMAYIYMANNYQNMLQVIDQLEIGRTIVTDARVVRQTRGGLPVVEKIKGYGEKITNNVKLQESFIVQRLNDFFDCQVYGRYLKDQGSLGKANVNKMVSVLLKYSSLAQLGFNWLANAANVGTGIAMQNIEAAASEYFSGKELLKADKEYLAAMKDFVPEIGARVHKSKLALFDEMFNLKQDYRTRLRNTKKKSIIERIFGANVAFLGQDGGDHWLYNRTAIAMCIRQKVNVPGKGEMSLWEALEVRDKFEGNSDIKEMYLPIGTTDTEGNPINIAELSRKIAHVNQTLFGIYNEEDSNAANRVAVGRLLLQYKKWMKPQFNKRFKKIGYNVAINDWEEGYYRTFARVATELIRGEYQLGALKDELSDPEKANINRCIIELLQLAAVWALANLVRWPDDKKRPWVVKFAEYMAQRLTHELGNLAPTPLFIQENLKTLKTPMASLSAIQNAANFTISLVNPADWNNELQSGPYEGHSNLYKNFMKAPIPGVAQYKMIDRFIDDLDTSIAYYVRSY